MLRAAVKGMKVPAAPACRRSGSNYFQYEENEGVKKMKNKRAASSCEGNGGWLVGAEL